MLQNDLKYEISKLYHEFLLRAPDREGLLFWSEQIINKKMTLSDLKETLLNSFEGELADSFKNGFTKTKESFDMYLNPKDNFLSRDIAFNKIWEINTTNFLKNIINEGQIVADIGANIGYFSLLLSKLVGSKGKVYSFEPELKNFEILKKNVTINNFKNIKLYQKAVSNNSGKRKFYKSNWNFGDHRFNKNILYDNDLTHTPIEIDVIRLDECLNDVDLDFMKIDVQGHEMQVIEGAKKFINNKDNFKMVIEFYPHGLMSNDTDPEEFLKTLLDLGFDIYDIDSRNLLVNFDILEICRRHKYHSSLNFFCEK